MNPHVTCANSLRSVHMPHEHSDHVARCFSLKALQSASPIRVLSRVLWLSPTFSLEHFIRFSSLCQVLFQMVEMRTSTSVTCNMCMDACRKASQWHRALQLMRPWPSRWKFVALLRVFSSLLELRRILGHSSAGSEYAVAVFTCEQLPNQCLITIVVESVF